MDMDRRIAKEIAQQITADTSKISRYDWALLTSRYDLNAIYTLLLEVIDTKLVEPVVWSIVASWDFASFDYTWDKTSTPWRKKFADKEELKVEIEKIIMRIKQERHLGIEPNRQLTNIKNEVAKRSNPTKHTKINLNRRKLTWEEKKQCFKGAVLRIMERKTGSDEYLFNKNTHWKSVYRFAVDNGIMYDVNDPNEPKDKSTPQYAVFEKFAQELLLDVNPPTRIPFTKNHIDDINKECFARFNKTHPWSKEGIDNIRTVHLYMKLDEVYMALKEEYDNLIDQAERSL